MVAEYIMGLLPSNWPLTIGDLPSTNVDALSILEYSGATSTEYFGSTGVESLYRPIIKIAIRSTSYEQGQQWAESCKDILHRHHDDYLLSSMLVGAPIYLGRDPNKFHEFQVTFNTQVKE